jgi:hypothetical protein
MSLPDEGEGRDQASEIGLRAAGRLLAAARHDLCRAIVVIRPDLPEITTIALQWSAIRRGDAALPPAVTPPSSRP